MRINKYSKYISSRYRCGCGGNLKFLFEEDAGTKYKPKRYQNLRLNDSILIYNTKSNFLNKKNARKIISSQNFDYEFINYYDYNTLVFTFVCKKCKTCRDFFAKDIKIYPPSEGIFNFCLRKLPPYITGKVE